MKRAILVCLVSGLLAAGSGCCALHSIIYEPFGPGTMCDPTNCDTGCGPTCGPACGPACGPTCGLASGPARGLARGPACGPACGPTCGPACDACGGACGEVGCGPGPGPCASPCAGPCGPLSWLFSIFTCGYPDSGCGEVWWGDFHGAPPDCCDPCDRCGNFTGGPGPVGDCASGNCSPMHVGARVGNLPPSSRTPRLISQTDRAVVPTSTESAAAPQVASSRRVTTRR